MSSSSSSSANQKSKSRFNPHRERMYDVFISFRRQDHCHYFILNLYYALKEVGFDVFLDNIKFRSGDLTLSGAIEGSRVSIIVFTRNYADSTRCLQELEKIMECRSSRGQVVVPVFYDADPSEVRHQTGPFGEALARIEERESTTKNKVLGYRTALQEAAGISPRFMVDCRTESEIIVSIVEDVTSLLDSKLEHIVGVQSRVQDLIQILNYQKSDNVLLLGIWGMGGIGKTTIAKALYDQISCNFEVRKFLPNIGDRLDNNMDSLASLRNELLSWFGRKMKIEIDTIDSENLILTSLCHKKVLLILDNVRSSKELECLFVHHKLFGPGSKIIITTRNRQPLREIGVDHVYRVKEMTYDECVELISWCAFKKATPEINFAELIKFVVEYCGRLPLALIAVGSILFKRSREDWEIVLERLIRFPLQDVQEVVKKSIDYLDDEVKQIFLEVAYFGHFFIGMKRNDVIETLSVSQHANRIASDDKVNQKKISDDSRDHAQIGIELLEDQSLVTFGKENRLCMHPLLQDIGREIYQKESFVKPEQRIYDVFLSFRGKDTRSKFTSHLHTYLINAGIFVFKDDDELRRGKTIQISILKAIDNSRISIIVLSTNYADSKWCLLELEEIMQCYRNKVQEVLPVFYHVDPSEVRNQAGKFGQAFENLIDRNRINKYKELSWRKALCEVGCISGFVILKSS